MITNFEQITVGLTDEEIRLIPILIRGFKKHPITDPITAPRIIKTLRGHGLHIGEPRLRKLTNFIRAHGLLPVMASHKGYYVSYDQEEIEAQIESLQERAEAIRSAAEGLKNFLNQSQS